jgi:hypothetical protein
MQGIICDLSNNVPKLSKRWQVFEWNMSVVPVVHVQLSCPTLEAFEIKMRQLLRAYNTFVSQIRVSFVQVIRKILQRKVTCLPDTNTLKNWFRVESDQRPEKKRWPLSVKD